MGFFRCSVYHTITAQMGKLSTKLSSQSSQLSRGTPVLCGVELPGPPILVWRAGTGGYLLEGDAAALPL